LGRRFDEVVDLVVDGIAGNAVSDKTGLQCFGRHNLFVYQYDSHENESLLLSAPASPPAIFVAVGRA
jgi:hypothetical protein